MPLEGGALDVVVIDSPPVLAVSDATVLGAQADAVRVVVRAGQTAGAEAGDATACGAADDDVVDA